MITPKLIGEYNGSFFADRRQQQERQSGPRRHANSEALRRCGRPRSSCLSAGATRPKSPPNMQETAYHKGGDWPMTGKHACRGQVDAQPASYGRRTHWQTGFCTAAGGRPRVRPAHHAVAYGVCGPCKGESWSATAWRRNRKPRRRFRTSVARLRFRPGRAHRRKDTTRERAFPIHPQDEMERVPRGPAPVLR